MVNATMASFIARGVRSKQFLCRYQSPIPRHFSSAEGVARKGPGDASLVHSLRPEIDESYHLITVSHRLGITSRLSGASNIGGHLVLYLTNQNPYSSTGPTIIGLEICDGDSVPSHTSQFPARNALSAVLCLGSSQYEASVITL